MDAAVVTDLDAGRDHDFPGMIVGIGEISGIAPYSVLCAGFNSDAPFEIAKSSTRSTSSIELQFHASVMPRNAGGRGSCGSVTSCAGSSHGNSASAASVEKRDGLARLAKFSDEAERLVERDAGAHVADAEGDNGQTRNGW